MNSRSDHPSQNEKAIRCGILSIPKFDEATNEALHSLLRRHLNNVFVLEEQAVGDQQHWIEETLRQWCDEGELDLILTVGAAMPAPGPAHAQTVPLATANVLERELSGVSEAMRAHAQKETELANLHCGKCGIRGRTLLVNLPAGVHASVLFLSGIIMLLESALDFLNDNADSSSIEHSLMLEETSHSPSVASEPESSSSGLRAEEFSAYLMKKGKEESE